MGKQPENALHTSVRWGGRAIVALSRPTLVYDLLVGIASRLASPGKSRRRLRKLNCAASIVPDALVRYGTIYALGGLIILLYLGGVIVVFGN